MGYNPKLKIAIIGHGFVGKAVDYGFNHRSLEKIIIDPKIGTSIEMVDQSVAVAFVCVPTAMGDDGKMNSSIVEEVVDYLKSNMNGLIIIKSTITPDVIEKLVSIAIGGRAQVVYNPEFLAEKSAYEDFVNPAMHIFGGQITATAEVQNLYECYSSCKPCPSYHMTASEASFVKYGINSYLATKVLWFNQFYDTVENHGGNYNTVIKAITTDPRVGMSHTAVPGFDGKRGYGGACFPKDTSAFAKFDPTFTILRKVIAINNTLRAGYEKDDREREQNVSYD
jgi:UDPglucose 6-dehydrogenase